MLRRIAATACSSHWLLNAHPSVSRCMPCLFVNTIRTKYINYGVQGKRENKQIIVKKKTQSVDEELFDEMPDELVNLERDSDYEGLANVAMHVSRNIRHEQNVLIIQPYIKWGLHKSVINPSIQIQEAEALISSLDTWAIQQSIKVGLLSYEKSTFFGRGKIGELRELIRKHASSGSKITCVFVSRSVLTIAQKEHLEEMFKVPVMDRFSVVIQILRLHATSRESKLQVALAEIPYIWKQLGDQLKERGRLSDGQKLLLRRREKNIKNELEAVRGHRQLMRKRRTVKNFPIIAVVGYTNAGKTALIKALTAEESIQPKNKLFATLDITAHGGVLPCNLDVIFMDTIGFMADIPTALFECFVATLEDAMLADLIIHVQDVSHDNSIEQRKHVEKTLKSLLKTDDEDRQKLLSNIITVGNKCDLLNDDDKAMELMTDGRKTVSPPHIISAHTMQGINDLRFEIEKKILRLTERIHMIIRVPMGGPELTWLNKKCAVTRTVADPKNPEYLMVHVVITQMVVQQFKNEFLTKKKQ